MIDRAATENPEFVAEPLAEPRLAPEAASCSGEAAFLSLEERVRRLEDGLAQVQDTHELEERIASRVLERVQREPSNPGGVRESTAFMLDTGRHLLPAAVGALQAHAAAVEAQARTAPQVAARPWLIVDLYADVRTLARMCRDPLYRTIWLSRVLLPLGLLAAIITSWIWLNLVPGFGLFPGVVARLLDKVVVLLLAFVLCKVLQREIRRYREAVPDQASARRS